jgi:arylsulfatase A-like enzyme
MNLRLAGLGLGALVVLALGTAPKTTASPPPLLLGQKQASPSSSSSSSSDVLRLVRSTAAATKLSVNRDLLAPQIAVKKATEVTWSTASTTTIIKYEEETHSILFAPSTTGGDAANATFTATADVRATPGVQYLITARVAGTLDISAQSAPDSEWERSTPTGGGDLVVSVTAEEENLRLRLVGKGNNAMLGGLVIREVSHRQPSQLLSSEDAAVRTYVRDDLKPKGADNASFQSRDREVLLASGTSLYEWPLSPSKVARAFDFETIDVPRHQDRASPSEHPAASLRAIVEVREAGAWREAFAETRAGSDHHWHRHEVLLNPQVEGLRLRTEPVGGEGNPSARTITVAWGRPIVRPKERPPNKPDVVIITIDALRADRLGVYGSTAGLTPNLDRIAKTGAYFTEARTPAGRTWEALTGIAYATWPDAVGVHTSGELVQRGSISIADVFADAGYLTARLGNVLLPPAHLGEVDIEEDDYDDRRALDRLVEILSEEHERPIFAWLHLAATHYPYPLDKEFLPNGMAPVLTRADLFRVVKDSGPPDSIAEISKRADVTITQTDTLLGRILFPILEKKDRPGGPAIVAVAADHGSHRGEAGIWFMHATMNRVVLRVPLIFSWPGHLTPRQSDRLVRLIDIGPTLLDLASVPTPPRASFVGESLRPILDGGSDRFMPRLMNRIVDLSSATTAGGAGTTTTGRTHGVVVIEDDDHKAIAADKAEYVYVGSGLHVTVPDLSLYAWRSDPDEVRDVSASAPLIAGELLTNIKGARATIKRHISPEAARLLRQAGYASPTDPNE